MSPGILRLADDDLFDLSELVDSPDTSVGQTVGTDLASEAG